MNNQAVTGPDAPSQNQLPAFSARQIFAAREYWSWRCAVCESRIPPIESVPWIPASRADSPGIVPTNMLPLCRACVSQKDDNDPELWLIDKLGQKKAAEKMSRIMAFFQGMADEKAVAFWYEIGLRQAIKRYLKSIAQRELPSIELVPGDDDDVMLWLQSLDSQHRQSTIKAALRTFMKGEEFDPLGYLESLLTRMALEERPLPGEVDEITT